MPVSSENEPGSTGSAPAPPAYERTVRVLAVSSAEDDLRFLRNLFDHSRWIIHTARGCAEAADFLCRNPMPVIVCDNQLADGSWRDLLRIVSTLPGHPLLIVTSRAADDYLWAEVLNLGGYDVLAKPFEPEEVIRVISLAWLHWKNLCERQRLEQPLLAAGT
ncbi:MAG: response regulator [Bryobacteraceae bacterium]